MEMLYNYKDASGLMDELAVILSVTTWYYAGLSIQISQSIFGFDTDAAHFKAHVMIW